MVCAQLLRLWVETAPVSIFPNRAIGKVQPGYEASFMALECDPTEDFDCVEKIEMRIKEGTVLKSELE